MPMPSSRAAKTHGTLPERSRRARHGNVRHAQGLARTGVREPRGLFLRTPPWAPHGARCSNAQDGGAPGGGGPAAPNQREDVHPGHISPRMRPTHPPQICAQRAPGGRDGQVLGGLGGLHGRARPLPRARPGWNIAGARAPIGIDANGPRSILVGWAHHRGAPLAGACRCPAAPPRPRARGEPLEIGPPRSPAARSPPKTCPSRPPGARWAWIWGGCVGCILGEMCPGWTSSRWLGAAGPLPGRTVARFDMDAPALHRLPEPPF